MGDKVLMWMGIGWIDVTEEGDEGAVLVVDDSPPEKAKKKKPKATTENPADESQTPFVASLNAISDRVDAACRAAGHAEQRVIFSGYPVDKDEIPVDNLDRVAVRGRVIVLYRVPAPQESYISPVLLDPTWLTLCVYANAAIDVTGDHHHVHFEGLHGRRAVDGVKIRSLVMGS